MKKEIGQIETIGQAAKRYGVSEGTFQKRIQRAITDKKLSEVRDKLGIGQDVKTGLRSEFTGAMSELLSAAGWDKPEGGGEKVATVASPERSRRIIKLEVHEPKDKGEVNEAYVTSMESVNFEGYKGCEHNFLREIRLNGRQVESIVGGNDPGQVPESFFGQGKDEVPEQKTDIPPMLSTLLSEPEPDRTEKKPDTATLSDRFFQSDIIVLTSLFVLILSDGFSMSLLSGRTFDGNPVALCLFSVVGLIIGYAAISTTRAAYLARTKAWQTNYANIWIGVFSIFQTLLHGAAFDLFSGWDALTWSDIIGRILIVFSIPLATASLTTTILKR